MKILYIITGLTIGGAERITIDLAERMRKRENQIVIIFLSGIQEFLVSSDINVYNLEMNKSIFGFLKAIRRAKKIVKNFNPDVVHANMFHAIIFSRILKLFVRIPKLICTEHSNNYHGKIRKNLERYTDFLSDINTNVSEQATNYFIDSGVFSRKKSITVYNGVDFNRFKKVDDNKIRKLLNISSDTYVYINVSRFNEAKDHKTLIESFNIVHSQNNNTKLICVGDGELLPKMKELAIKLGIEESVIFTGAITNTEDYYNAADCFVLSSLYEGFGIVLVEAMACELEIISTDCGGTKEIVCSEDLVPISNSSALANKMIETMKNSLENKEKIGVQNRELVSKFNLDIITNKWLSIYMDI